MKQPKNAKETRLTAIDALCLAVAVQVCGLALDTLWTQTPNECAFGVPCGGDVARFGETVLFCITRPHHRHLAKNSTRHKGETKWRRAIRVGNSEDSNEHLFLTQTGRIVLALSSGCHRKTSAFAHSWLLVKEFRGTTQATVPASDNNIF